MFGYKLNHGSIKGVAPWWLLVLWINTQVVRQSRGELKAGNCCVLQVLTGIVAGGFQPSGSCALKPEGLQPIGI